jgi:UDP-N-acetylmuramoylalanine--D-glutamate ligase
VAKINDVEYYNDSKATNTDAAIKALANFARPIVLIAGGSEKNSDFAPWVKMFTGKVSRAILIGETAGRIAKACDAQNFSSYVRASTLEEAVGFAKEYARAGSIVLFSPACASFDMFKNFEERGELFKKYVVM